MLLDIIILVLRETLEAGAVLSLLVCISKQHDIQLRWLWISILIGAISAIVYAINFSTVGEWFEYAGQEVVNAAMQLTIYLCLLSVCVMLLRCKEGSKLTAKLAAPLFAVAFALAITRELSEMIIFYTGFMQSDGEIVKALTSGFIGLMIGISFGVLCFYAISSWSLAVSRVIQVVLLTLIAAGMSVQATQLLIQVDWISAAKPVWSTSAYLSESSTFGQMTYAVFGYEATPTLPEVVFYLGTLLLMTVSAVFLRTASDPNR